MGRSWAKRTSGDEHEVAGTPLDRLPSGLELEAHPAGVHEGAAVVDAAGELAGVHGVADALAAAGEAVDGADLNLLGKGEKTASQLRLACFALGKAQPAMRSMTE